MAKKSKDDSITKALPNEHAGLEARPAAARRTLRRIQPVDDASAARECFVTAGAGPHNDAQRALVPPPFIAANVRRAGQQLAVRPWPTPRNACLDNFRQPRKPRGYRRWSLSTSETPLTRYHRRTDPSGTGVAPVILIGNGRP